jgi:hypothetical protein
MKSKISLFYLRQRFFLFGCHSFEFCLHWLTGYMWYDQTASRLAARWHYRVPLLHDDTAQSAELVAINDNDMNHEDEKHSTCALNSVSHQVKSMMKSMTSGFWNANNQQNWKHSISKFKSRMTFVANKVTGIHQLLRKTHKDEMWTKYGNLFKKQATYHPQVG